MVASSTVSSQPSMILIIDPDPVNQRQLRDRLTGLGYAARSVDDYNAAIEVVNTTPPDVILLTAQMGASAGWDTLQTRLNQWGIPVVNLGQADDDFSSGEVAEVESEMPTAITDDGLRSRVEGALRARTLQDALLAENARLVAERLQDPLTGLFNRRYIMIRVEEEVLRSSRRGHPLACMLIDMDSFDTINEEFGHAAGDAVLRDMAHVLTRTMRGTDITCRYRDDEFLVLLTDTDASGAQIAANRLRDAIAEHHFYNSTETEPIKLTASIGVAYWQPATKPGQSGTWEPQLVGLAERALRAAKQSGMNRLVILQAT